MTKVKKKTTTKLKKAAANREEKTLKIPSAEELFDAGVYFGHLKKRWNPKMAEYIYTQKEGIHIFDLYKTRDALKDAAKFLKDLSGRGEAILFVGTKRQAKNVILSQAKRCGAFYLTERWVGGLFTNFSSVKKNTNKLKTLEEGLKSGEFKSYTKKERLMVEREIKKLETRVGGLRGMEELPGALVLASAKAEGIAVKEAAQVGVPVVAIVDTNASPTDIDYPIPGNDDAVQSIEIIIRTLADACAGK